jgi:hypothetical protein
MKLFNFIQKKKDEIQGIAVETTLNVAVKKYIALTRNVSVKNHLIVEYIKKDSEIVHLVLPFNGNSVEINKAKYIVDIEAITFIKAKVKYEKEKKTFGHKIPITIIYEGRTEAISAAKWANDDRLSEKFQRIVFTELLGGIMELRAGMNPNLRKILVYGLIGIVVIVIIIGALTG